MADDKIKSSQEIAEERIKEMEKETKDEPKQESENGQNSSQEQESINPADLPPLDFLSFIMMLSMQGMQQLGKIANPMTGKVEKDLLQAKQTITLLEIFEEKTKGNLTKEEESYLKSSVTNLRLNYVEEINGEK